MFYPARHDDEFAFLDPLFAFTAMLAIVHAKSSLYHIEHLVFVLMMVPGERTLKLYQLDELAIELTGDAWIPVIGYLGEFLCKVDLVQFMIPICQSMNA